MHHNVGTTMTSRLRVPNHCVDESVIIDFYRRATAKPKPRLPFALHQFTLTNTPQGLGDTVVLTHLPRISFQARRSEAIYAFNAHFKTLVSYNPYWVDRV